MESIFQKMNEMQNLHGKRFQNTMTLWCGNYSASFLQRVVRHLIHLDVEFNCVLIPKNLRCYCCMLALRCIYVNKSSANYAYTQRRIYTHAHIAAHCNCSSSLVTEGVGSSNFSPHGYQNYVFIITLI
jgi:hypothetical protein